MDNRKITIIGLGLIGGSLARALNERLGMKNIIAVNRSERSIYNAVKDGTIRCGYTDINDEIYDSDIIFLCTPVKRAIEILNTISKKVKPDCIITDVGSTKAEIIEYIDKMTDSPCFIGGHPMAGTEKTGYSAGFVHLFENAYYVLSPSKSTTKSAMRTMVELVKGIGALPVVLDATEHDRITGSISHVPHIIASGLVNMVKRSDSTDGKMQMLAAGGFKDITRIASSSPEMWENIVLSNKEQIRDILENYITILGQFKEYIDKDDTVSIYDYFAVAKEFRDSFATLKTSTPPTGGTMISPLYEIIVDVIDTPGIIGKIATILGGNGVNIKNINVSNSREFEQGCLRITLPDFESANFAFDLLTRTGYKVYRI